MPIHCRKLTLTFWRFWCYLRCNNSELLILSLWSLWGNSRLFEYTFLFFYLCNYKLLAKNDTKYKLARMWSQINVKTHEWQNGVWMATYPNSILSFVMMVMHIGMYSVIIDNRSTKHRFICHYACGFCRLCEFSSYDGYDCNKLQLYHFLNTFLFCICLHSYGSNTSARDPRPVISWTTERMMIGIC